MNHHTPRDTATRPAAKRRGSAGNHPRSERLGNPTSNVFRRSRTTKHATRSPSRRRAELLAATVLILLLVLTAVGWWAAPAHHATTPPAPGATGAGMPFQYTATDLPTGGLAAATALIIAGLILGAVVVGRIFYSPSRKRR